MPTMEQLHRDALRARIAKGTMTQELWSGLSPDTREALRDNSDLTPQLIGLEGWRVEVTCVKCEQDYALKTEKRRFIVGRSTGWKPYHLEISRKSAFDGRPALASYDSVRKIEKARLTFEGWADVLAEKRWEVLKR